MNTPTFAQIVATARGMSELTAAEFDYDLAFGLPNTEGGMRPAHVGMDMATGHLARQAGMDPAALRAQVRGEFEAMIDAAKAKNYTGWSRVARSRGARIRYA